MTEPAEIEDLGVIGDGKSDRPLIASRDIELEAGESKSFTFQASSAIRAWADTDNYQESFEGRARVLITITGPDGKAVKAAVHAEPSLVLPRPADAVTYTLTFTNVGDDDLDHMLFGVEAKITNCGSTVSNACGGCGELDYTPGDACGCGGLVARCDDDGGVTCNPAPTGLPATNDRVDEWTAVSGSMQVTKDLWEPIEYSVYADDTLGGILQPQLEYDHPGGFTGEVCLHMNNFLSHTAPVNCAGEWDLVTSGCCREFGMEPTTVAVDLVIAYGTPSPLGEDWSWDIRLRPRTDGGPVCAPYTLRYRF